jgi:thioredoxin-dependent peroxiredoxin
MNILKTLSAACSFLAMSLFAHGEPLAVGAPAPEVSAVDQNGKMVSLKELYAKGPVLVYFYPKSDTPGCTKQACSLRDDWKALQEKGIQVVGVSGDKVEDQKKFTEKYTLPFTVLADPDFKVAQAFGSPNRARNSFLIKDGKIVWTMLKASTQTHAADVLKAWEEAGKKS